MLNSSDTPPENGIATDLGDNPDQLRSLAREMPGAIWRFFSATLCCCCPDKAEDVENLLPKSEAATMSR